MPIIQGGVRVTLSPVLITLRRHFAGVCEDPIERGFRLTQLLGIQVERKLAMHHQGEMLNLILPLTAIGVTCQEIAQPQSHMHRHGKVFQLLWERPGPGRRRLSPPRGPSLPQTRLFRGPGVSRTFGWAVGSGFQGPPSEAESTAKVTLRNSDL